PGMAVADVSREVVARGHIPAVRRAQLGVPIQGAHRSFLKGRSHVAPRRILLLAIIEVPPLLPHRDDICRPTVSRTTRSIGAYTHRMATCTKCGQDNPDGFRFCGGCGAALTIASVSEERKVVTVLFADLVGFTSRSERMDVEDVRGTLAPYHALLREQLEHYGGTVEKFIGDAVMALFGAPVAHEDDPERAVRAALSIR